MKEFQLRPYKKGDEHSINRGFNQVFGLERPLEEWRWKFQPDADGCRIMVSLDCDDQVIAHFAAIRVPVQIDGRIVSAGQSVDNYCVRRYDAIRRQTYIKTVREFYDRYGSLHDIAFLFGFPGERHLKLGRLRLQFASPAPIQVWQRPASNRRIRWPRYSIRADFNGSALDRLWQVAAPRYAVSAIRDSTWLKRRYLGRPNNKYIHLSACIKGIAHAWTVLQIAGEAVQLIDLLWDGQDPRAVSTLETEALSIARSNRASKLEMWLSGDKEAEAFLLSRGWEAVQHPQKLHMTSVAFDPSLNAVDIVRRFYLTMGDSDLF